MLHFRLSIYKMCLSSKIRNKVCCSPKSLQIASRAHTCLTRTLNIAKSAAEPRGLPDATGLWWNSHCFQSGLQIKAARAFSRVPDRTRSAKNLFRTIRFLQWRASFSSPCRDPWVHCPTNWTELSPCRETCRMPQLASKVGRLTHPPPHGQPAQLCSAPRQPHSFAIVSSWVFQAWFCTSDAAFGCRCSRPPMLFARFSAPRSRAFIRLGFRLDKEPLVGTSRKSP